MKKLFKVYVSDNNIWNEDDLAFVGTYDECIEYVYKYNHQAGYYIEPIKTNIGLCKGRHNIPFVNDENYVFDEIKDIKDTAKLYNIAYEKLKDLNGESIYLYVTGLTVALIATLNVCKFFNINVTLMHYDKDTNEYFEQVVL
jgi:hypothetical protein